MALKYNNKLGEVVHVSVAPATWDAKTREYIEPTSSGQPGQHSKIPFQNKKFKGLKVDLSGRGMA